MITIYRPSDDTTDSIDPCYLQIISVGTTDDFGTSIEMASSLKAATIERSNNGGLVCKDGTDDFLYLTKDGQIQIDGSGKPANPDGYALISEKSTEVFAKIVDESSALNGYYQGTVSGRLIEPPDDSAIFVTEVDDSKQPLGVFRFSKESDTDAGIPQIRVWLVEYHNFLIRQFITFDVSYSEIVNTYENENGNTIQYPIRLGKRKINLELETDIGGLEALKTFFQSAELLLLYKSPSDATIQYGHFRKTSDIQIQVEHRNGSFGNCPFLYQQLEFSEAKGYFYDLSTLETRLNYQDVGIYRFSVSLEEV